MVDTAEYFHSKVLSRWDTSICPVCCYMKNPHLFENASCMQCGISNRLLCCLICGHIGCSQVVERHAIKHYKETKHSFAMGLKKFKVWNYETREFIHNLKATDYKLDDFNPFIKANEDNNCACTVCQHKCKPKLLKQPTCMKCNKQQELLICLSCNYVGCSTENYNHAQRHYAATLHTHVMRLDNFSIWDYGERKYRHLQPYETMAIKSAINLETKKDNVKQRLDRLERQWQTINQLKDTYENVMGIQERLLNLTDEKKSLQIKLNEQSTKLTELSKLADNYEKYLTTRRLVSDKGKCTTIVPSTAENYKETPDYIRTKRLNAKKIFYLCSPERFHLN